MDKRLRSAGLALSLAAAAYVATVLGTSAPAAVPANAPSDQFSAERGFVHVQAIAKEPHPSGSKANAAVVDYITAQLTALGLSVETQPFAFTYRGQPGVAGVNLLARIPGTQGIRTNMILLACHHDSVPGGPGASDDGAGVATLLETARALKAGPVLQNDILLLFTDGEESNLDGAKAFVGSSSWVKDIALVLNFEARGVSGAVFMFETSSRNGFLIKGFAKAVPYPSANSLMFEVYRKMPNDTDLTVFKRAGLSGLNFAFIGDPQHYHKPTDDIAHFSKETLQHAGAYALNLSRYFGNLSRLKVPMEDAVYFDLLGRWFVHYSGASAEWLTGLVTAFFAVTVWKLRSVSLGKSGLAALAWVAFIAVTGLLFRYANFSWLGGTLFTIALAALAFTFYRRWLSAENLAIGGLLLWLVLAVALTSAIRGASYLAVWPLLFGTIGLLLPKPWRAITDLPVLILASPLVKLFYVALGPNALFVPMVVLALMLAALSWQFEEILYGPDKTASA